MKRKILLKRGSNQHMRRHRGLKAATWESILLIIAIAIFAFGVLSVIQAIFDSPAIKVEAAEIKPAIIEGGVVMQPAKIEMPMADYSLDEILHRISMLESTGGANTNPDALHNLCKAQGKSNIYGYGGMALMICFESEEEAAARIKRWFTEHLRDMSLKESLCYYNLGIRTEQCDYVENFMKMGGEK